MKHSRKRNKGGDLDRHQSLVGSSRLNQVVNEHVAGPVIVSQDLKVERKATKSLKVDPPESNSQSDQSKMTTPCLRSSPQLRISSSRISLK